MFEKATRLKLRFNTPAGILMVEDLWDLPLTSKTGKANLDDIARDCSKAVKASQEESFVTPPSPKDKVAELRFEIVKHVINVKIAERDAEKDAAAKRARKQKIMEIMERKQDAALEDSSLEDLQKELDAL